MESHFHSHRAQIALGPYQVNQSVLCVVLSVINGNADDQLQCLIHSEQKSHLDPFTAIIILFSQSGDLKARPLISLFCKASSGKTGHVNKLIEPQQTCLTSNLFPVFDHITIHLDAQNISIWKLFMSYTKNTHEFILYQCILCTSRRMIIWLNTGNQLDVKQVYSHSTDLPQAGSLYLDSLSLNSSFSLWIRYINFTLPFPDLQYYLWQLGDGALLSSKIARVINVCEFARQ